MKLKIILFTVFVFFLQKSVAQNGCPDPQASNFVATATQNDGSCIYPPTTALLQKIAILSNNITETSGLVLAAGKCWTHNDSDGFSTIFSIDTLSGNILQTVHLEGVTPVDWEEITTDGQRIFIGDFGNNAAGNRTNLAIYAINLSDIKPAGADTLAAIEIQKTVFFYPDQTDFSGQPSNTTEFDCEAFIWQNNRLHLFTKDWKNKFTTHYALDFTTGFCEKLEIFPFASGLITGASVSADGQKIVLLGYDLSDFTIFSWLLWDFPDDAHFFAGNKRKIELGSVAMFGQTEAIVFSEKNLATGFISNEQISQGSFLIPAAFWQFDFSVFFQNLPSTNLDFTEKKFDIFPNPATQVIHFQGFTQNSSANVRVFDQHGKLIFFKKITDHKIDVRALSAGVYFLEIENLDGKKWLKRFVKTE